MEKWFYIGDGNQKGPFTLEELKKERITANTLVWMEKMANWEKAKHLEPLKAILEPVPPPMPDEPSASRQEPKEASTSPKSEDHSYFGYELGQRKMRLLAMLTEALIYGLMAFLFMTSFGYDVTERPDTGPIITWTDVLSSAITSFLTGMLFYPLFSGNLGHRIFGLKVISSQTGKDYNSSMEGGARELLKTLLAFLLVPVVWIVFDKDKQNLYDKVTKTLVVKKKIGD